MIVRRLSGFYYINNNRFNPPGDRLCDDSHFSLLLFSIFSTDPPIYRYASYPKNFIKPFIVYPEPLNLEIQ